METTQRRRAKLMHDSRANSTLREILRVRDQRAIATCLAASLLVLAAVWLSHGGARRALVDIDRAPAASQCFQLDANRASWWEWTLLPGIGETLARRIVDSRRRQGPFDSPESLLRVRGIGPTTLERLRPHLLTMRDAPATDSDPGGL